MSRAFTLASVVSLLHRAASDTPGCQSSSDCSLNGDCDKQGMCRCDPGWSGSTCAVLNLAAVDISESYIAPGGTSSWGMSLAFDEASSKWHGFVSEFANKCKLSSWTTNSYVNHVVADAPEGPWEQGGHAISEWSHNPKVVFSEFDNIWLLYHIGSGQPHGQLKNCSGDTTLQGSDGSRPGLGGTSDPFAIHSAASLDGPWVPTAVSMQKGRGAAQHMTLYPDTKNVDYFELVLEGSGDGPTLVGYTEDAQGCRGACQTQEGGPCTSFTWMGESDQRCFVRDDFHWIPSDHTGAVSGRPWEVTGDNPSPWIDPTTGEVRVLYRTDDKNGNETSGYFVASLIGQATAPNWKGPYEILSAFEGPISSPQYPFEENEDPFLWKSSRGWHALFHSNTWTDSRSQHFPAEKWAGRHAFSTDGLSWTYSPEPAYNASIRFTNGTVSIFSRMERPFLIFDEDGKPTHLFNGVQQYDWDDYTFTLMHRVLSENATHDISI